MSLTLYLKYSCGLTVRLNPVSKQYIIYYELFIHSV